MALTSEADVVDSAMPASGSPRKVSTTRRRPFDPLTPIVLGVLATAASWLRLPAAVRDTMWAEDGQRFLQDALDHGAFHDLLVPYAGYLHVVPRLVVGVAAEVAPTAQLALAISLGSAIVVGLVTAVVYVCSGAVFTHVAPRILIASITALAPLAPVEVLGSVANLHWYLLWMAPWLLLHRPRTRRGAVVPAVIGFLAALTEIQLVVFLPLVVARPFDRRMWLIRAGVIAGLAGQFAATVLAPRPGSRHLGHDPASTLDGFLLNVVLSSWLPPHAAAALVAATGWVLPWALALPFAAAFAACLRFGGPQRRILAWTLGGGSVATWLLAYWANQTVPLYARWGTHDLAVFIPLRYAVVPQMLLLALLVAAATTLFSASLRRGIRLAALACVALAALMLVLQFTPTGTRRDGGPEWMPWVERAERVCTRTAATAPQTIPIAPARWGVVLGCSRLDG